MFQSIVIQLAFRACSFIASNKVRQIPRPYTSAQPSVPLPTQCNATTAYAFLEPILHVSPSQIHQYLLLTFLLLTELSRFLRNTIKHFINPPPWPPGSPPVVSSRLFPELNSSDLLLFAQWPLQKFAARMSFWSSSRTSLAPRRGRGVLK